MIQQVGLVIFEKGEWEKEAGVNTLYKASYNQKHFTTSYDKYKIQTCM